MRTLLLAITTIGFCATAGAQRMTHDHSPGDIYIGYSLLNGDAFSTASGFEAALTGNINDWFGLKADFSGNYKSQGGAHAHEFNMLFGPQVSTKGERLRLFGHGLIGIAHTNIDPGPSDSGAGWVLGGGADYAFNDQVAWRVAQLDYHGAHLFGNTQKDFRFSTGILFRFR
ncbi:MAG TPA: outer membrane beta-barrel protein [Candidatus Angelobacter sp.]|nr:outer membrane beta-barrel protein [Candidatus Angelobacter sp.]